MDTKFLSKQQADAGRSWQLIDADAQPVGRLATKIASVLRGKHNPCFSPHQDCGDFVVVINAEKAQFSGNKMLQKKYHRHSGYVGGIKEESAEELMERQPEEVIRRAVKGMLPRTDIGKRQLTKLKIYTGSEHPHAAQQPKQLEN